MDACCRKTARSNERRGKAMMGRWLAACGVVLLVCGALHRTVQGGAATFGQQKAQQPQLHIPDEQVIEYGLSEMLAGWQIGDVALMQKYYAADVAVVSGTYEPPLIGWNNYLQAYLRQRERVQSVRLERRNTFIHAKGTLAWAAYQWEFEAMVDGKPSGARGHTTLVLEKRGERWLIVHNHTSLVAEAQVPEPAQPPAPPKPGK